MFFQYVIKAKTSPCILWKCNKVNKNPLLDSPWVHLSFAVLMDGAPYKPVLISAHLAHKVLGAWPMPSARIEAGRVAIK
jgi:hypothetical protein